MRPHVSLRSAVTRPTPLRLGLIGCGEVARRFHLPALARLTDRLEVTALADVDEERCRSLADRFRVPGRHASAHSLIASDVEAIAVCVPSADHARVASEVLRARKHLFLEKPIALSLADADRLLGQLPRASVVAMTGFNLRWHRLAQAARDLVRSGRLGRIRATRGVFSTGERPSPGNWRESATQGGHVLLDLGVHHFDLLRFLTGAEVEKVSARSSDPRRAEVSCALSDGTPAEIALSAAPGSNVSNAIEIEGERGDITLSFYPALGWRGPRRRGMLLFAGMVADRWQGGAYPSSYRRQWQGFADACRSGAGSPGATLADGRAALAAALLALESAGASTQREGAR